MLEEKDVSPGFLSQDCCTVIGMPDCAVCKLRLGADDCQIYKAIPDKYMFDHKSCPDAVINKESQVYQIYLECQKLNKK